MYHHLDGDCSFYVYHYRHLNDDCTAGYIAESSAAEEANVLIYPVTNFPTLVLNITCYRLLSVNIIHASVYGVKGV